MKATASAAQAQTTQVRGELGSPFSPRAPFVIGCAFVRTTRMISEKPSVAMAR